MTKQQKRSDETKYFMTEEYERLNDLSLTVKTTI